MIFLGLLSLFVAVLLILDSMVSEDLDHKVRLFKGTRTLEELTKSVQNGQTLLPGPKSDRTSYSSRE